MINKMIIVYCILYCIYIILYLYYIILYINIINQLALVCFSLFKLSIMFGNFIHYYISVTFRQIIIIIKQKSETNDLSIFKNLSSYSFQIIDINIISKYHYT